MADFGKGKDLLELESVQRQIDAAASWAGSEHARSIGNFIRSFIAYFRSREPMESPLEAIFFAWFHAIQSLENTEIYLFSIEPQETVTLVNGKTYRFDFFVRFGPQQTLSAAEEKGIPQPKVVIELDGHEFHERTKEQVAYRNERDRDLQAEGWTVLHFSGSELYRDPLKCAQSVFDLCKQKTDEWTAVVYGLK